MRCPYNQSRGSNIVSNFSWFFKYQPIASEKLAQPSRYKIADGNWLTYEKGPHHWNQGIWLSGSYIYTYTFIGVWIEHIFTLFLRYCIIGIDILKLDCQTGPIIHNM